MRIKYFLILVFVFVIIYLPLFFGFFQQDEWMAFSGYILASRSLKDFVYNFLIPNQPHFVPIGNIVGFLEFEVFRLNYLGYAMVSLVLHFISGIVLYFLARKIFDNKIFAIFTLLVFLFADYGYQVVSWPAGNLLNQLSVILVLSCIYFFVLFLKKSRNIYFWCSWVLLIFSLFCKENGIAFFLMLPIIFYLFSDHKLKKKYFYPAFIFITGIFYGISRVIIILETSSVSQTAVGSQSKFSLFYNLITFPVKAIAQTFVPVDLELAIAKNLSAILPYGIRPEIGTTAFDIFVQNKMLEILSFMIFFVLIGVSFRVYRNVKKIEIKRALIFGFIFLILNSFIFALSPDRTGIISIIDSRNLYFLTIGSSIIVSVFIYLLFITRKKWMVAFVILFFGINFFYLHQDILSIQMHGSIRKNIIMHIKHDYPRLSRKVIFYTESDTSFYGLPANEKILPFQSGFGQTLLVFYEQEQNFPSDFFKNNFLWDIGSQGYKEIDGVGFGYFRDFEALLETIKDNKLSVDSVIAYKYNSQNNMVTDVTRAIRVELAQYEKRK